MGLNGLGCGRFSQCEIFLIASTSLAHPVQDAIRRLTVGACTTAAGAVPKLQIRGGRRPLSDFSQHLKPEEVRYTALGGQLLTPFLFIKDFSYLAEGRTFHVMTEH